MIAAGSIFRVAQRLVAAAALVIGFCQLASADSPTLVAQRGVTAPASIPELARALKYDYRLIYEYVYTNIEFTPTYGLRKGALGTLLDGNGNDMDQASLLVALLRESGYTANFVYGSIRLSPSQVQSWLGVDTSTDSCPLLDFMIASTIPFTITVVFPYPPVCLSPLQHIDLDHTWVTVTGGSLGSTTYVLDPSFKTHTGTTGINLATAIGYNQSTFLSSARSGSTITGDYVQNINRSNLRTSLAGYANSLVSYIKANMPAATTNDVLGGRYIQPLTQPWTPPTSLAYETPDTPSYVWTGNIPDAYRTTLEITIGGVNKTYFADELYGHRLTIVYNSSLQPVLYLDGIVQDTGTASATTISYEVTFPFCWRTLGPSSPDCVGSGYTNVFAFENVIAAGSGYTYAIVNGWGPVGRGMVEFHRSLLQASRAAGGADTSEAVLGEALNLVGYAWLAQLATASDINDRLLGTQNFPLCNVGVVGQAQGPYIDIPGGFTNYSSLTGVLNDSVTAFYSSTSAGSALEWGTLAQDLAKANVGAVSTVNLLDIANSNGLRIYDATSTNWSTIQPLLSNYATADMNRISNAYIADGYRVILPQSGNLTQGNWTGVGYLASKSTSVGSFLSYGISSNLKGGYPDFALSAGFWVFDATGIAVPEPQPTQLASLEPIDLSSGAYFLDHDDLAIGSGDFPIGLGFRRSYSSSNRYQTGPLGRGWSHGFSITAIINSDGFKGMAQNSPIDGAPAIAAAYVIKDMFSDSGKPLDKVVIATLAQRWWMDQLIDNVVNVTTGIQSEQFVLLADGSYNPRLSSSNRLTLSGGNYTLQDKEGTTFSFNSLGNIVSWVNTAGATVTFAYDAASTPKLTSVSNNLGRTLTLAYNGSNQLTSVTDGSRTVTYGYDSSGNLTSFTDPNANITTFAYATSGGPGLLTQIFYPSFPSTAFVTNVYDTLGRVATQTNAMGATWNYFFAGYRSEEDDANGTQHVLYYNPRGKALFDIQDAAGLNRVTRIAYDGLDRPILVTMPEGNSTAYTYATTNAWANNVATVTQNPKSGSPLSPLVTSYTYDTSFNKPLTVTDPRGLVSTMIYNPGTGTLHSVVADSSGGSPFKATTRFTYNGVGQVTALTDPMGMVTQYTYDGLGNRTSTVRDAGTGRLNQTTAMTYDVVGNVLTVTDPNGRVTTNTYDAGRRLLTTTSPPTSAALKGMVTTYAYDADNRNTSVQQSSAGTVLRTTGTTYTPTGKTATTTDPNGNVTRFTYDALERLARLTDAENRITTYSYDALSRRTGIFNPAIQAGALWAQSYTANGLRATLTDANGNVTGFTYDGVDRLSTVTYADTTTETFAYDADGNVTARKTRANQTIAFTYDTLNRLATKTLCTGGGSVWGCFNWNGALWAPGPTPSAPVVTYAYDLNGRLTSASDNSTAIPAAVPPGGAASVKYTATYSYDGRNRPTGVVWDNAPVPAAPTASSVTFGHSYNKVNQRIGQTVSDNTWLNYPSGTGTTAYTANNLNQYTAVGGVTPTYDGNGNLTSDGTYTLGYDAENRLTSSSGGGNTAAYTFDAQNRRKTKTVNGTTTVFVTDADNREVLEYDGSSGTILNWYAYGLGPNDVLGRMELGGGTRTAFVPDLLGSTVALMASATGVLTTIGYLPYGTGNTTAPFGFTGQRVDLESGGLYYYRARHYSPVLGRFLQADPARFDAGLNFYRYVLNDPLNLVDSQGLAQEVAQQQPSTFFTPASAFVRSPNPVLDQEQNGSNIHRVQSDNRVETFMGPWSYPTLDPLNLNKGNPVSDWDRRLIADALNNIDNNTTSPINAYMNPHPYVNRPDRITGAQLPPASPQGYISYYVNAYPDLPGQRRLVIDQGTGATYYSRDHYRSFIPVIRVPSPSP